VEVFIVDLETYILFANIIFLSIRDGMEKRPIVV
jgi:hypothetical protein